MTATARQFAPIDDLQSALLSALADVSRAEHRFLHLLFEFDWRRGWAEDGSVDCADWLGWKCGICRSTALEKVRVAKALQRLPQIDAAFGTGRLSYSQVRALSRVADADNERELLGYAHTNSADALEQYCSRLRNADPEAAAVLAHRQQQGRCLTWYRRRDGSGTLNVTLPAAEFELVLAALEQAATTLPEDADCPLFARSADALVALARNPVAVAEDEVADRAAPDAEVIVHVDAAALSAESGGSADLPLPAVRRLCCDGTLRPMITQDGQPLNLGRRQRTVSKGLKRALQARDRQCRFPGCHHHRYVDAHHIVHWADGGETNLENLVLLCSFHHTKVHEGGYGIERTPEGELLFRRPDGRPLVIEDQHRISAETREARLPYTVRACGTSPHRVDALSQRHSNMWTDVRCRRVEQIRMHEDQITGRTCQLVDS